MITTCGRCGEVSDCEVYGTGPGRLVLCGWCDDELGYDSLDSGPDDEDFCARPALGRTHPYTTGNQ